MRKFTGFRSVFFGIALLVFSALMIMAAAPSQGALPAGPSIQETVLPPEVNPTIVVNPTVVIPQTGGDTATTSWFIPVVIIIGVALVVLVAVALAGRGTRTDV